MRPALVHGFVVSVLGLATLGVAGAADPYGLDGVQVPLNVTLRALRNSEFQTVVDSTDAATLTVEELRQGILACHKKITSLRVTYTFITDVVLETAPEREIRAKGRAVKPHSEELLTFAAKGRKYYEESNFVMDPKVKRTGRGSRMSVFDGDETRSFNTVVGRGTRTEGPADGLRLAAMQYARFFSFPIEPQFATTYEYIPRALSFRDMYRVKPTLENVDGRACHVVVSDFDAVWVDHGHGFSIPRRILFVKTGLSDPGSLSYVQSAREFVNPCPGVWLPETGVFLVYTSPIEPEGKRGKLAQIQRSMVSRLDVNNVPDSLFEVGFGGGMIITDQVAKKKYITPHGQEMLDRAVAAGRPIIDAKPGGSAKPTRRRTVLLLMTGVTVMIILALTTRPWWGRLLK